MITIQIRHGPDKRKERADFNQKLGIATNVSPTGKSKMAVITPPYSAQEKNTDSYYSAYIAGVSEIFLKRSQTFQ